MPATDNPVYLSIVIPVFNEAGSIGETLRRIEQFLKLKSWNWEIIVSDDGSTDETADVVRKIITTRGDSRVKCVACKTNKGKGAAVRAGVLAAKGAYILMTDADLSAPVKEVDRLLAAFEDGFDIALGSRAVRDPACDVQQSFKRRLAGRVFNFLVKAIVLKGIGDTQCGFKCFKGAIAHDLFARQKIDGFSFDVEILCLAQKKGFRIKEVAVMWKEGRTSRIRLVRDSVKMVKELFLLRSLHG